MNEKQKNKVEMWNSEENLLSQSESDEFVPAGLQEVLDVFLSGRYTESLQSS